MWSVDATDPAAWPVNAYLLALDVCGVPSWGAAEACNGVDDGGGGALMVSHAQRGGSLT